MSRPPSKEVYVSEIMENGRHTVTGYIVDFDPNLGEGKLDDGTGILRLILENFLFAEDLEVGNFVRVMGRVYLSSEGRIMRVEVAQRLGVSPEVYKKVKELERRVITC